MEFGIFDHLDRSGPSLADYYEDRLQAIAAFDRAGFYSYHVAEHHFTPLGMAPSPSVFLAAAAQRTRRIRLGTMVYALPLHHPLRVAEEICMLDHLTGGRLDIGFGRGSVPVEIAYYGVDPDIRQEIYAERLEVVLKALREKTLTVSGRFDTLKDVPIEIAPLQQPHPPVWYGAHSPDSAARAARRGLQIITNDALPMAAAIVQRFGEVWREVWGDAGAPPKMGVVRHIFVADSDAEALAIARRAYVKWLYAFKYLHNFVGVTPALGERPPDFDGLVERGVGIAGTPRTVLDFLAPQLRESGANYLVGHFCFGDLTREEMLRSIALFAEHVMPALRELDTEPVLAVS